MGVRALVQAGSSRTGFNALAFMNSMGAANNSNNNNSTSNTNTGVGSSSYGLSSSAGYTSDSKLGKDKVAQLEKAYVLYDMTSYYGLCNCIFEHIFII